jgi:hypothetical protein
MKVMPGRVLALAVKRTHIARYDGEHPTRRADTWARRVEAIVMETDDWRKMRHARNTLKHVGADLGVPVIGLTFGVSPVVPCPAVQRLVGDGNQSQVPKPRGKSKVAAISGTQADLFGQPTRKVYHVIRATPVERKPQFDCTAKRSK